jgi:hypothetical protein
MTLRSRPQHASPVVVFDGSILATAALAYPEVMVKSAGTALECFGDLADEEREILFETFQVWQDTDASVGVAAERRPGLRVVAGLHLRGRAHAGGGAASVRG